MVYYFVTSEYFSPNVLPGKPSPVSNLSKIHVKCRDKEIMTMPGQPMLGHVNVYLIKCLFNRRRINDYSILKIRLCKY